jgi:hypothetical protein
MDKVRSLTLNGSLQIFPFGAKKIRGSLSLEFPIWPDADAEVGPIQNYLVFNLFVECKNREIVASL